MTVFNRFFIILFVTIFCASASHSQYKTCELAIENSDKIKIRASVEIAADEASRRTGLMFRRILDENEGMLFVFPNEQHLNFWMKNTYLPLSIAYADEKGIIREIYEMKPLDTSITYPSRQKARFALEMKSGWFKKNNINEGCRIIFNGCLGK